MLSMKSIAGLGALLAAPLAAHAGPLAYDNPLGITVAMEEEGGPAADPAGRLSAAIVRLQGTLGQASSGPEPKIDSSMGVAIAVVARQFSKDPGQVHMLVASDGGGGVCHIRAPARTESQSHIPQLLLLCLANFGKPVSAPATPAAAPVAAPKPAGIKAAPNARFAQNWAKVEGVYFRSIANFGVGGMMIMDFEPIILFKDGSYVEIRQQALEDMDLTADRQARPKLWGRWSKAGAAFVLTGYTGKSHSYELQQGQFFKAYPASIGKLLPAYKRVSGGGNSAMGGEMTIAVQSKIAFSPDGRFVRGANVGALNSGSQTGWATAVSASNGKNGTYTVKGHTITLTYADGKIEREFFAFASKKTPPQPDTEMIFIGDSVYTSDD
ncbi:MULTISPECIES: hypothetical protein [Asticcacaulis]|uniref:hypothetical protein n=1 Tax=Asticcacaulis TaxID=76890 RepID=UPI001AEADF09|nr:MULTISPECIES: hypothetical protein [Asticcacaulis]MBP2159649.1 hypothetical protein [Asticcacaulis solisilvae]MDR6800524.1 hypothetical protein [Asticcacaulis sp. BE141]